jgi:hypothetical protein
MGERTVISYPDWVVFGSVALVCVPISVARLSWGSQVAPGPVMDTLPWVALAIWLWLTYQILLVEVSYDERGVSQVSPLAGHVRLAWSEIRRLHFFPAIDGFRLETGDGRHFTLNLWRVGSDRLVEIALAKLGASEPTHGPSKW